MSLNSNCGCIIPTPSTWDPLTVAFDQEIRNTMGRWSTEALQAVDNIIKVVRYGTKMDTTARLAIVSPVEGEMIYDITLHKTFIWDGSIWNAAW